MVISTLRAGRAPSVRQKLTNKAASARRFFESKKSWKELGAGPRGVFIRSNPQRLQRVRS